MFCINCGTQIKDDEKFCTGCGVAVQTKKDTDKTSEIPQTSDKPTQQWWQRLGIVVYILAHLPLLIMVPLVWSSNAEYYSSYSGGYRGSDSEAFWYCILTILIWVGVLRLIKLASSYVIVGAKPKLKDLLYF